MVIRRGAPVRRLVRAAGLIAVSMAVTGAAAADLKGFDAAAVPTLDACPNGGMKLSGTGACLRLSGRVRAEAGASSASTSSALTHRGTTAGLRSVGSVAADVRVPTELGPVRTYVELRSGAGRLGR